MQSHEPLGAGQGCRHEELLRLDRCDLVAGQDALRVARGRTGDRSALMPRPLNDAMYCTVRRHAVQYSRIPSSPQLSGFDPLLLAYANAEVAVNTLSAHLTVTAVWREAREQVYELIPMQYLETEVWRSRLQLIRAIRGGINAGLSYLGPFPSTVEMFESSRRALVCPEEIARQGVIMQHMIGYCALVYLYTLLLNYRLREGEAERVYLFAAYLQEELHPETALGACNVQCDPGAGSESTAPGAARPWYCARAYQAHAYKQYVEEELMKCARRVGLAPRGAVAPAGWYGAAYARVTNGAACGAAPLSS
ncbi:ORF126 [Ranid herpesvirus 1]|uniref:ORF126 n=1 Tax=Ranid herpesvirus 1 TaxID=85655 RepID=Q14VK4_9VIRU|nr:ORF126 [Ranid herpesvirus 1]ABG25762.1 ORF126 [Ranid herpesvirus 1]